MYSVVEKYIRRNCRAGKELSVDSQQQINSELSFDMKQIKKPMELGVVE